MKLNLMRIFSFALLLCVLLPACLAGCGDAAVTDPVTDETTAPTSDTGETDTPAPAEGDYKYVAIIGVDGAGAFFRDAETPALDEIFKDGAVTYTMLSENPTISAQCWGAMLHGVTNEFHGLNNSIADTRQYSQKSKYPSIFRVLHENDPDITMASFCHWSPINIGIIEEGIGVYKENSESDEELTEKICAYVKDNTPNLLYVQFDEVDGAGHSNGYGLEHQLETITRIDGYIGKIYETYGNAGILDETLFIVTADHGGEGQGHGGQSDTEKYVMFAAAGHTVEKGSEIKDMEIRDTAAVVLHAFGYNTLPETWTARVPSGLFEGVEATERKVMKNTDYHRYHENVPTPAPDGGAFVTDAVPGHSLLAYLPFDGSVETIGEIAVTANGTIEFAEGFFGEGACLDNGYAALENIAIDQNSFTVSVWLNIKDNDQLLPIFSAKGDGATITLNIRGSALRFNINIDGKTMYNTIALPDDYINGWMPLIVIVDREAQEIRICYDYGKVQKIAIPDALSDASFSAMSNLSVGQSGVVIFAPEKPATMDEFMILDGALTDKELEALAVYYGKTPRLFDPVRDHASVPTPAEGSDAYITNFISGSSLKNYLTFDGAAEDSVSSAKTDVIGGITYEDGFFGQGVALSGGYITLEDHQPGMNSFSVSLWVKNGVTTGDPALFSNKDWSDHASSGYVVSLRGSDDMAFNFGDGTNSMDITFELPTDHDRGWMHIVTVFDRENGEVRISRDFEEFWVFALPDSLKDDPANESTVLCIGQDATGNYKNKMIATVDEFMVFDGALTQDDVYRLADYYGVTLNK